MEQEILIYPNQGLSRTKAWKAKTRHFLILDSIYFVQDGSYYNIGHVNECRLSSCYFCSGEQNWTLFR